jgi:hypothetical protein
MHLKDVVKAIDALDHAFARIDTMRSWVDISGLACWSDGAPVKAEGQIRPIEVQVAGGPFPTEAIEFDCSTIRHIWMVLHKSKMLTGVTLLIGAVLGISERIFVTDCNAGCLLRSNIVGPYISTSATRASGIYGPLTIRYAGETGVSSVVFPGAC